MPLSRLDLRQTRRNPLRLFFMRSIVHAMLWKRPPVKMVVPIDLHVHWGDFVHYSAVEKINFVCSVIHKKVPIPSRISLPTRRVRMSYISLHSGSSTKSRQRRPQAL